MKNIFSLLSLFMVVLVFFSCASAPKTDPLAEAVTKVEASKQRAIDYESPAYFPSEWEQAEAQAAEAKDVAAHNTSADTYDELFKKSIPLYAQAREDEITSTRETLINTGFTKSFPEYLAKADEKALDAMAKYEAEDYYGAKEAAADALNEYETLLSGAQVYLARQEIIDRGFSEYDSDNFKKADEIAVAALDDYDAGKKEEALAKAEEALLRYNIVLSNGWVTYSADRRKAAVKERELALEERANVASRDIYRNAETFFTNAEENYGAEKFNDAALGYVDAEAMFAISRKETEEKRIRAEEAIRIAAEKIEESSETAIEAERIIEGGSR